MLHFSELGDQTSLTPYMNMAINYILLEQDDSLGRKSFAKDSPSSPYSSRPWPMVATEPKLSVAKQETC